MQGAIVLIQIGAGADVNALHKDLHGVPGVKEVYLLAGPTDVMCQVEGADLDGVGKTVVKMHGVKGVASTDTRLILPFP